MQFKFTFSITVILAIIATSTINTEAVRRIKLRPLSAKEVVRILKAAGREDAIPEGRVVTQGIAAMTGFTLGLTTGIGGAILFELANSNVTSQFINSLSNSGILPNFEGFNITALMQMLQNGFVIKSNGTTYQTIEICFDTRAREPLPENKEYNYDEMERKATNTDGTDYDTTGAFDIGTGTADRITTNTDADTRRASDIDTSTGTHTETKSITQTGTGDSQTCVVILKPILPNSRSIRRRRRHSSLDF